METTEEKDTLNFLHSGDIGDIIAGLGAIKELCEKKNKKANIFLDTSGGLINTGDYSITNAIIANTGGRGLKFKESGYKFIHRLIEVQPYVAGVYRYDQDTVSELNITIDYNMNAFRKYFLDADIARETNQNLLFLHQKVLGLDIGYKSPWLFIPDNFVPDESKECHKPHSILIGRTTRCQSAHAFLSCCIKDIQRDGWFMGLDLEHKAFENAFDININRLEIEDAFDALIAISKSNTVIFNSTSFFWIAVGSGHQNIIHELGVDIPTSYFPNQKPQICYVMGIKRFK